MTIKIESGRFSLEKFILKSMTTGRDVDIGAVVYSFTINESMSSGFVSGTVSVFDSTGVFYDLPIRGEETIEITYTDYYENTRTDKFVVYSVDDIKVSNQEKSEGKMLQYTLKFVSVGKFESDKKFIRKSFTNDIIKSYVDRVFKEYYAVGNNTKSLSTVELTSGNQEIVIPNYTPEDAMHMFARRAASDTHIESNFRFFETREKYYFTTNGNIYATAKKPDAKSTFEYMGGPDLSSEGLNQTMQSIIDIRYSELVDTIRDRKEASYLKDIVEIDFINRSTVSTEYDYLDRYTKYKYPDKTKRPQKPIHDKKFIDDNFERNVRQYVFKDYSAIGQPETPGLRSYPYSVESISDKNTSYYHARDNAIEITVYGRNNLMPGMVIQLNVPQFKFGMPDQGADIDTERTGLYLVESISNEFVQDIYKQKLVITKSGLNL